LLSQRPRQHSVARVKVVQIEEKEERRIKGNGKEGKDALEKVHLL